ncbi:transcription antitermination factor NusB [Staphylococcus chromogenes]|nr:transcription antitermination factor NusB [Staphylococcus chromogenes]
MALNSNGGFRARSKKGGAAQPAAQDSSEKPSAGAGGTGGKRTSARGGDRKKVQHRRSTSPQAEAFSRAGVDQSRAAALSVLHAVRADDAYANLVLPKLLRERGISGRDAAFATELTYGALRTLGVLDAVIEEVSGRRIADISPDLVDVLRLGAYQLLYTRVEPHAAVDTAVRAAVALGQEKAKGFVNANLRSISRATPEQWMERLTPADPIAATAFQHAHPEWIARSFAEVLGTEDLPAALAADSQRPIVHLVARPGEISAEELALISGGEEGKYSPYAVYLESGDPGKVEPVREGLAGVQDEGSQIIARAVAAAPVDGVDQGRWLDLCAGPGGKAALLGGLARIDGARIDAVELTPHRAKLVEQAVRDLPVTVHTADGRNPGLASGYDRILVDAPCSGLGALRRRPEARWRKQESDIAGLAQLQFDLLSSAASLARSGGVIVYSTCSPDLRETRAIVDRGVAELGLEELPAHEYACGMDHTGPEKSVQMWPHRHGTDAMFFAVLRKV